MRTVKIPKKNGKFRTIYIPSLKEKILLRSLAGQLEKKVRKLDKDNVIHGFVRHRSPVSNASQHVGHTYSLSFDLENFFDTVTPDMVKDYLSKEELAQCFVDGHPRQGLPTSPHVCNLAALALDRAILAFRDKKKIQFIYTRYADDLTFSYDDPSITSLLLNAVPQICGRCRLKVNKSKTHLQSSSRGRRIITGIGVDDQIYPTREMKRRLRAAKHQNKREVARGLEEWCKLKSPRQVINLTAEDNLEALQRAWNLPKIKVTDIPNKGDDITDGDFLITSDAAYTLGMSTYTTGWTSCMSQPNGQYRRGTLFWLFLEGSRIACLLSDKTKSFGGVERRVMRARALVHILRNGVKCYDRIYGNPLDREELKDKLVQEGYISVAEAKQKYPGEKVVGNAPYKSKPYCDNLKLKTVKFKGKKVYIACL